MVAGHFEGLNRTLRNNKTYKNINSRIGQNFIRLNLQPNVYNSECKFAI